MQFYHDGESKAVGRKGMEEARKAEGYREKGRRKTVGASERAREEGGEREKRKERKRQRKGSKAVMDLIIVGRGKHVTGAKCYRRRRC